MLLFLFVLFLLINFELFFVNLYLYFLFKNLWPSFKAKVSAIF